MISVERIGVDDRAAWGRSLDSAPHAFVHTHAWCAAVASSTGSAVELITFAQPSCRAWVLLEERGVADARDVATPYGGGGVLGDGDWGEFERLWQEHVGQRDVVAGHLRTHPLFTPAGWLPANGAPHERTAYLLDLRRPLSEVESSLRPNRRAAFANVDERAYETDPTRVGEFLATEFPRFLARREAPPRHQLKPTTLLRLIAERAVVTVGVREQDRVVAAALFGVTPHCADYLFNVSAEGAERHSTALVWYGIRHAHAAGIPWMNLGGGVQEQDGVAAFKASFGAARRTVRVLRQIYRPERYAQLCRELTGSEQGHPGVFPAYRAL